MRPSLGAPFELRAQQRTVVAGFVVVVIFVVVIVVVCYCYLPLLIEVHRRQARKFERSRACRFVSKQQAQARKVKSEEP